MDFEAAFTRPYNKNTKQLITEAVIYNGERYYQTTRAIWDTGATICTVSEQVATLLSLKPEYKTKLKTSSEVIEKPVYRIDITIPGGTKITGVKAALSDISNQGLDLIIGMEIIGLGDFAVSNYDGKPQFTFRIPSQAHIDFTKE